MTIPNDYAERVYAGVLGKIIGVYLGRPFEGWSYEAIMAGLGEIDYYVHEKRGVPLIVTDDDISGTFTFLRALPDYCNSRDITPAQIGQTWLNYIIEDRAILWWGGMGNSTEHTAFLRLKHGVPAPASGSIAMNGKVVAEQIGAQIFIDGWGMVAPGDPELAADLARRAASVSHDGEAIYGAQVVAAIEAQAFVERDIDRLIDTAVALIPQDSVIFRVIADLRDWAAAESDWHKTRERIVARYGYDKYGGGCHMVPNHALVIHALLHGEGDFQRSLKIVNTCGWDTDCNSANVGCIMGIRNGLAGIDDGPDWRGPVADRLFLPTADGGRCITDAAAETYRILNVGRELAGLEPVSPKGGARFHFELPGSVQGFVPEDSPECRGTAAVENADGQSVHGERALALRFHQVATGRPARVATATFIPDWAAAMPGYGLIACPTVYPGQRVRTEATADRANSRAVTCTLYLRVYGAGDKLTVVRGPSTVLAPAAHHTFEWRVPDTGGQPIAEVGFEVTSDRRADGALFVDYLTWEGTPEVAFRKPEAGEMWRRAWADAVDHFEGWGEPYKLIQDEGTGLLIQGTREWTDYEARASITPHLAASAGIAARVQGLKRYYALLLCSDGKARLVKALDGERTLAEAEFAWQLGGTYELVLAVECARVRGMVDGKTLFDVTDSDRPFEGGAVALVITEGRMATDCVYVQPA